MEKDSKDQEERRSRTTGSRSCPSGPLKDSWARAHIIQAGIDLFIGKDEAYIMNRKKKKEESMLRKEGNVYVVDLFVRVPPSATTPIRYDSVEVDATNQVTSGCEQRKRVTFNCNDSSF